MVFVFFLFCFFLYSNILKHVIIQDHPWPCQSPLCRVGGHLQPSAGDLFKGQIGPWIICLFRAGCRFMGPMTNSHKHCIFAYIYITFSTIKINHSWIGKYFIQRSYGFGIYTNNVYTIQHLLGLNSYQLSTDYILGYTWHIVAHDRLIPAFSPFELSLLGFYMWTPLKV